MPARQSVRPIAARSVVEQVTDELRRAILSGALAPGEQYSLRELAGMLEVSFIPIREALRSLEGEGLVTTSRGRSVMIAPLDLADLQGIYRLRRSIEPDIARRSCALLTDADLDELDAAATGFGDHSHGMADIYDDHIAFHLALLAPAVTTWENRVLTTLWRAGERYIRIGIGRLDPDPAEHHRRAQAHVDLVAHFRTRDPEQAATAIAHHLAHNEQIALKALTP
ncbi:GntR family transcriptional regulator [Actinocorallia sp. A-T 12471]|uniref:GntR family transcriptional regulator n=1 Tax=Actinocorallia sp. A-T 12471 TaxID=3089813 RepID=UPI0029CDFB01|nr:GntR family transcriptional regulator [Actinocorallia sp. A-T 12471]MDX6744174.1 GntR family transcriptional regulator [Actinocorallia sp. A-T 12471]